MIKFFSKYTTIGILNTLIHWIMFAIFYRFIADQAICNFLAFCVAVTFSFIVNAKFTFNAQPTKYGYLQYVSIMASLSYIVGYILKNTNLPAIATPIIFSMISLIVGFFFSYFIIFRSKK